MAEADPYGMTTKEQATATANAEQATATANAGISPLRASR
jgi:hypothetical protein